MTVHRRLEERLAAFVRRETALLFGARFEASAGVIAALARPATWCSPTRATTPH